MKYKYTPVYKRSLFVDLVRLDNDFSHTKRNPKHPHLQIYYFTTTEKLHRDIAWISGHEYVERGEYHANE